MKTIYIDPEAWKNVELSYDSSWLETKGDLTVTVDTSKLQHKLAWIQNELNEVKCILEGLSKKGIDIDVSIKMDSEKILENIETKISRNQQRRRM